MNEEPAVMRVSARIAVLLGAVTLWGCIAHEPGVSEARSGPATGSATGSAPSSAGGTVAGGSAAEGDGERSQRGNTPPGVDRSGHGPAAGAIVDPTGAATRGNPY